MVSIEEAPMICPKDLIQKYFSQLKSELLAESSKVLTKDLQAVNPVKYNQVETSQNYLIQRIELAEERCIDRHFVELKQNNLGYDGVKCKSLEYQEKILKAAFARDQHIFANLRFKEEENLKFGVVVKVNEYISKNGIQLIKRELSKFKPSKSLSENVSAIFEGLQFKTLTRETLQIWFILKTLYKFSQEQSVHNFYHEIDLRGLYSLKEIEIYFKNCQTIPTLVFNDSLVRLSSLKKLLLLGNDIKEIHPSAFSTLHNLEILNLDANRLEWINYQWFTPLFNLRELYLSNNCLKTVGPHSFHNLIKLEILEIDGPDNNFKYEKNLFAHLESLETLKLGGIHETEPEIFGNLTNLKSLSLSRFFEEGISFDESYFKCLVNLKAFSIQNALIGTLKEGFLSEQLKLELLTVQDCRIRKIEANAFRHLKELKQVFLLADGIDHIDKGTFRGLDKLNKIDLSYNKFEEGHLFGFEDHDESIVINL